MGGSISKKIEVSDERKLSSHHISSVQCLRVQNDLKGRSFEKKYSLISVIGEGSMGTIYRVRRRKSLCGQEYALKTLSKSVTCEVLIDEMKNEISLIKELDHPNIIRAYETFEGGKILGVITELCTGKDLHSRLPYKEKETARIVSKILSAVQYLHSKNIVHRDIKLENIMFESSRPNSDIKLIDFGLAKKILNKNQYLSDYAGTEYTMAPEVLTKAYTTKVDLWSVGVTAYTMMSGKIPSPKKFSKERLEHVFKGEKWDDISGSAKLFVFDLLNTNPVERPDAREALQNCWLEHCYPTRERTSVRTKSRVDECIFNQNVNGICQMKKLAAMIIAHNSSAFDLRELKRVFASYDQDGDGIISYDEFKAAFSLAKLSDNEIQSMFDDIDFNGDRMIEYTEFLGAAIAACGTLKKEKIAEAFSRIDSNDSKQISVKDLQKILGDSFPVNDLKAMVNEVDKDGNGKISLGEFYNLFRSWSGTRDS